MAVFGVATRYYSSPTVFEETFDRGNYFRPYSYSTTTTTVIKIYNTVNKQSPFLEKEYKVCGSYFNGRKLDNGFVYIITKHYPYSIADSYPWYDLGIGRKNIRPSSIFYYPKLKYESI